MMAAQARGVGAPPAAGARAQPRQPPLSVVARNRTAEFARARLGRRQARGQRLGHGEDWGESYHNLLACEEGWRPVGATPVAVELSAMPLPPRWVDAADTARGILQELQGKLAQLLKAQQRRLQRVFGDTGAEQEVDAVAVEVTTLLRRCEALVREVGADSTAVSAKDPAVAAKGRELQRNAQRALAGRMQTLSQRFRGAQQEYLREVRRRRLGGASWDDCATTASGGSRECSEATERWEAADDQELMEVELNTAQRNEEIARIAASIHDLHTIFRELAVLTIEQGSVLDRIDYNIEQVVGQSQQANTELKKAVKRAKGNGCMRLILGLSAVDLLLILVLVLKTRAA